MSCDRKVKIIDWNKDIQTRDGRKAEYVRHIKDRNGYNVACLFVENDGYEYIAYVQDDGSFYRDPGRNNNDIINVPDEVFKVTYTSGDENG